MGLKIILEEVDTSGQRRSNHFKKEVQESENGIYLNENFFGGENGVTLGGNKSLYPSNLRPLVPSYRAPRLSFHQGQTRITNRGLEFTIGEKTGRGIEKVQILSNRRSSTELLLGKVYELRISSIILTLTVTREA